MSHRGDGNTFFCEACDCWLSPGNVASHNNGRRHRANAARSNSNSNSNNNSINDYDTRSNHQSMPINRPPNSAYSQQQQQQSHYLPPVQFSTSAAGLSSVAAGLSHPTQSPSPVVPTMMMKNNNNNNNNNMMMMNNTSSHQSQSRNQQQHQQQRQVNYVNDDDDDDDDYQNNNNNNNYHGHNPGAHGGDASFLCNNCMRLCSPEDVAKRNGCPSCGTPSHMMKQVFVSHHSPTQSQQQSSRSSVTSSINNNSGGNLMMMSSSSSSPQRQQQSGNNNNNRNALTWSCDDCTFINPVSTNSCTMCGYLRAGTTAASASSQSALRQKQKGVLLVDDDDVHSGPSAVCSRARQNAFSMIEDMRNGAAGAVVGTNRPKRNYPGDNNDNTAASSSSMMMMGSNYNNNHNNNTSTNNQQTQQQKEDVNAIMVEMDEKDTLKCVFCLNSLPTHHFLDCSCENTILCSACAVDVLRKFRPATQEEIDYEANAAKQHQQQKRSTTRGNNNINRNTTPQANNNTTNNNLRVPDPKVLRCFVCCKLSKAIVAAPTNPNPWKAPPNSTYPWIASEESDASFDKFVREILAAGKFFLTEQISHLFATKEEFNDQVRVDQCRWVTALEKFRRGWRRAKCPEGAWSGVFGWHGNRRMNTNNNNRRRQKPVSAIFDIAKHNFDPNLRRVNNHGPGEYFSPHFSQSLEYAKHNNTLALTFILRGKHFSLVEDFAYICKNRSGKNSNNNNDENEDDDDAAADDDDQLTRADNGDILFCLPLYLVHFHDKSMGKWTVPRFPYLRWVFKWQNDEESDFISYDLAVNQELNKQFCLYHANTHRNDDNPYIEKNVNCFNMETKEENEYCINFKNYTQTNVETDFLRKITVVCVPATPLPKTLWIMKVRNPDFQNNNNNNNNNNINAAAAIDEDAFWTVCDMYAQREICDVYFDFQKAKKLNRPEEIEKRKTKKVTIWGRLHLVDVERFRATLLSDQNTITEFIYPLAIIDS